MKDGFNISQNIMEKIQSFDEVFGSSLEKADTFHVQNSCVPKKPQYVVQDEHMEKTYADGLADGRDQAQEDIKLQNIALQDAAQNIHRAITTLRRDIEDSHGRVLSTILDTILVGIVNQHTMIAVKNFISQLSAPALQGCVTVHVDTCATVNMQGNLSELTESILKEITTSQSNDCPQFKLKKSKTLAEKTGSEMYATWQGGGASLDLKMVTEQCLALLDNCVNTKEGSQNGPV